MAAGAPAGTVIEIEFTPGSWTDVSAWVDWSAGCSTTFGRPSVFSQVSPSTMTLTVDNTDGRFTPLQQTLVDGTPHPYWPNVLPRKRIRRTLTTTAAPAGYVRFVGQIKGWPTTLKNVRGPRVTLVAEGRLARLAKVTMLDPIRQELFADNPSAYWSFNDGGSAMSCAEELGGAPDLTEISNGSPIVYRLTGPSDDAGTSVGFNPLSGGGGTVGDYFHCSPSIPCAQWTLMVWANAGQAAPAWAAQMLVQGLSGSGNYFGLALAAGVPQFFAGVVAGGSAVVNGPAAIVDAQWHHLAAQYDGTNLSLYVDGVLVGSVSAGGADLSDLTDVVVGYYLPITEGAFTGRLAHLSWTSSLISAARIAVNSQMGHLKGELVSARIARFLGYANVAPAQMHIAASVVPCGTFPQAGADVASACQSMVDTEGADSVFYDGPDGRLTFYSRSSLFPVVPVMILDAAGDLDGTDWSPTFGDDEIVNSVTGSRNTGSGAAWTGMITDPVSLAAYDVYSDDFTSYATTNVDVRSNMQDRLARSSQPLFRLDQVTVDLWTAQTAGLYDDLGTLQLASRIRITNLYPAISPAATIDLIVEGGTETINDSAYSLTLLTSAADSPAPFVLDDPVYGRAQCDGQTLTVALSSSTATTVQITSLAGDPTFTTATGDYPLTIQVGTEHIQLTAPPSGSASPQTFTGCVRGVDGTTASPQAAGAAIDLYPILTVAL